MVTLLDLKKDKMKALKEKDALKQNVLGIVISNYQMAEIEKRSKGQEMGEADMVQVLNKTLKALEDEKAMYVAGNRPAQAEETGRQIEIVSSYLPKMMSEEEIRAVIDRLPDHSMKTVMQTFHKDYAGKADMALVSKVAKSYQGK